ncbi:ABC transporter ATP-binding protein [Dactylosporangium sp. NPDC049140]|uniref:ABC transporter ATP-binding protein n=1 Tax=Dactylosporangium sp. NPDC049140 TaxID=3155647 RepID=UPI0033C7FD53
MTIETPTAGGVPLLETRGLTKHFPIGRGFARKALHAVDDADLSISRGEIVALAGESGSGKSTVARLLAGVYKPTGGEIYYQGEPLSRPRSWRDRQAYRGDVPMVFQDPFSSLNPAYRVSHGIMRGIGLHRPDLKNAAARRGEAERVVEAVGLVPAPEILSRYPHELSGGQRQRIGFAQALAHRPTLILADEPVSMLDVSIRIELLNLMARLRADEGVSFLYITHDIAGARYVADRIVIMYAGHIVESGPTETVLADPRHPYTRLLLSAVPDPRAPLDLAAAGDLAEPPSVVDPAAGCRFRRRCASAVELCHRETPLTRVLGPDRSVACHLVQPTVVAV